MTLTSLKSAIEKQNDAFMRAAKAGDAKALAALYTSDAWLLPHGADAIRGRDQIEKFWKARFERIDAVTLTTVDMIALGEDGAREVGTSKVTLKGGDGQQVSGKYMVVWRSVDGDWKLESDMMNGNAA